MKIIEASSEYLIDQMTGIKGSAHGVVKPENLDELIKALEYATDKQLSVIVIGANTGLSGATVPQNGELLIDLSGWQKIIDFDESTLSLTVEAGVTLNQIYDFVESKGYFYPPDPGAKEATIAGNIATNAGGMRAVKYGVTRDYVKALQVVLIDGTVLELGSINQKDSTNYDLKDLLIGSEGTLGIITQATLKVVAKPEAKISILASFATLALAIENVDAILKSGIHPASVEFFEGGGLKYSEKFSELMLPIDYAPAYLLLTLDGLSEIVEKEQKAILKVINNAECVKILNRDESTISWQLRDNLAAGVQDVTIAEPIDIVVPTNRIIDAVGYLNLLGKEFALDVVTFGHAGDGNIHALILKGNLSDEFWNDKLAQYLEKMYQFIAEIGGLASAEHGIGLLKRSYFLKHLDTNLHEMYKRIKVAFDPENRLNPGKKI